VFVKVTALLFLEAGDHEEYTPLCCVSVQLRSHDSQALSDLAIESFEQIFFNELTLVIQDTEKKKLF